MIFCYYYSMQIVQRTKNAFLSGKTRPLDWRIKQLKQFIKMLEDHRAEFNSALTEDLRRVCSNIILTTIK